MPRRTLAMIGLGVMGEPICRHLATKSGAAVLAFDLDPAPLDRLAAHGVTRAPTTSEIAAKADVVFLALPSGAHVERVCSGPGGLLAHARRAQIVVDLGTSPVALAKTLAADFAAKGAVFCDAPIARTRQAAEQGALSLMFGGPAETLTEIRPYLATFASDITHCGPVGHGQAVKILNNMVLIETVVALSEALAVARAEGVDGDMLFRTLMKGSADSFALRNHGLKAVLPGDFPERAFSAVYARKDIGYALSLAAANGIALPSAEHADQLLDAAIANGLGDKYWPVISALPTTKK